MFTTFYINPSILHYPHPPALLDSEPLDGKQAIIEREAMF